MKFETLKRGNKWYVIGGVVIIVGLIIASVITTSRAKYRTTQSIPLVRGTINYKVPDLNVFAMYQENDSGEFEVIDSAPTSGYTLNTTQSQCTVNGEKDTSIGISYASGKITITDLTKRGAKCYIYFDKSTDTTVPTISNVASTVDKTSITVTVTASDDTGLSTYYYSINNGTYESKTTNSHTFSGLTAGTNYTIKVYVTDTSGNSSVVTTKTITTEYSSSTMSTIMASYTQNKRTDFSTVLTTATTKQVYSVADDLGTSYYFAGAPTDNWVSFGGFYWRIIRMNGDGSTRMIYAGTSAETTGSDDEIVSDEYATSSTDNAYLGYMYGVVGASSYANAHANTNDSNIKGVLDKWYSSNLTGVASFIDGNAGFCNDRSVYSGNGYGKKQAYYSAFNRLSTNKAPSLKCTNASNDLFTTSGSSQGNGKLTYPIGLITADEVAYAGGVFGSTAYNTSYYLYTGEKYFTMTPYQFYVVSTSSVYYAYISMVGYQGRLESSYPYIAYGVRPVINLKASVKFTGAGTSSSPFRVSV